MPDYPTSLEDCHRLIDQLYEALDTRDVIGQAKGILIAREQVDAGEAFAMLVRASQRQNRKLREIAADIVAAAQQRDGALRFEVIGGSLATRPYRRSRRLSGRRDGR